MNEKWHALSTVLSISPAFVYKFHPRPVRSGRPRSLNHYKRCAIPIVLLPLSLIIAKYGGVLVVFDAQDDMCESASGFCLWRIAVLIKMGFGLKMLTGSFHPLMIVCCGCISFRWLLSLLLLISLSFLYLLILYASCFCTLIF